MLATLVAKPFHKTGWVYEEKYDGDRLLAYKENGHVRLISRNGKNHTSAFPEIVKAVQKLRPVSLLLDGEVVVFDRKGVSRFQLLQQNKGEPVFSVFDCLYCDGEDLRQKPLLERRRVLEQIVRPTRVLALSRRLDQNGLKAYEIAKHRGYEGLVAKDLSSAYLGRRSNLWLKVKVHHEDEFLIAGFTPPEGSRHYFGALLLAAYGEGKLRYVGKVGTGFDQRTLAALYRQFQPLVRTKTELTEPPRERNITFLAPKLIAQISYQEWTADHKLRQPVYLGLRDDKRPAEVILPEVSA